MPKMGVEKLSRGADATEDGTKTDGDACLMAEDCGKSSGVKNLD